MFFGVIDPFNRDATILQQIQSVVTPWSFFSADEDKTLFKTLFTHRLIDNVENFAIEEGWWSLLKFPRILFEHKSMSCLNVQFLQSNGG